MKISFYGRLLRAVLFGCSSILPILAENSGTDIRGIVKNVRRAEAKTKEQKLLGTVLIEGAKEADTQIDTAVVRITNETRILEQKGTERRQAGFDALKVGAKVEVRFTGPVQQSYPVQATAAEIVILP